MPRDTNPIPAAAILFYGVAAVFCFLAAFLIADVLVDAAALGLILGCAVGLAAIALGVLFGMATVSAALSKKGDAGLAVAVFELVRWLAMSAAAAAAVTVGTWLGGLWGAHHSPRAAGAAAATIVTAPASPVRGSSDTSPMATPTSRMIELPPREDSGAATAETAAAKAAGTQAPAAKTPGMLSKLPE